MGLFWDNRGEKENREKSINAVFKLILEANEEIDKVSKSNVFRKLEAYENIAKIIISLLYISWNKDHIDSSEFRYCRIWLAECVYLKEYLG